MIKLEIHAKDLVDPQHAYRVIRNYLHEAGIENSGVDAQLLIRHVSEGLWFALDNFTPQQAEELARLARRRGAREPMPYLLGRCSFLDLELAVGPGVLIPRPETEEVCLYAAKLIEDVENPRILDLCAGSGAIALGLQDLLPRANVTAVEWMADAYYYLQQNVTVYAKTHAAAPAIKRADVLTAGRLFPTAAFDLIVCNPPYVSQSEYVELDAELRYEPKEALVPGDDVMEFYEVVARDYKKSIKPGGFLVFEIGAGQSAQVQRVLTKNQYTDIWVSKDIAGRDRISKGQKRPAEKSTVASRANQ